MSNVTPLFPDPSANVADDVNAVIDLALAAFDATVDRVAARRVLGSCLISEGTLREMQESYRRMAGLARTGLETLP